MKELKQMTDHELKTLSLSIQNELEQRANTLRIQLWNNVVDAITEFSKFQKIKIETPSTTIILNKQQHLEEIGIIDLENEDV